MNISLLTSLGLTKKEADVYLATLQLGSGFVSTVARAAKIDRVNCYHTLNNLMEKGLVSSYTRNKVKTFTAENPKKLVEIFEEKKRRAEKLLPELLSITNVLAFKPKIHFFEGIEGIKNIFTQTLETHSEIVGYTNIKALMQLIPEYLLFYCRQKTLKQIKTRLISPKSPQALSFVNKYYPHTPEARSLIQLFFVNPEQFNFENEINIFENKVAIVSLNPEELIGVMIESAVVARTMKRIFDLSWLGATSFIAQ